VVRPDESSEHGHVPRVCTTAAMAGTSARLFGQRTHPIIRTITHPGPPVENEYVRCVIRIKDGMKLC